MPSHTELYPQAACTGDRPGITKHLQMLHLDKDITLIDCPGVVVESQVPPALTLVPVPVILPVLAVVLSAVLRVVITRRVSSKE